jgi:hypothetical protein
LIETNGSIEMKRTLACLLAAGGLVSGFAMPAHATSRVRIYEVYYNSPGSDDRSNTSLNGEWIKLKNSGTTSQNLYGWKVKDAAGHTYTFSSNYYLAAGATVHVHTGSGTNSGAHRFWKSGAYIWNNTGDTAKLYNKAGTKIQSCTWGSSGSYKYC